MKQINIEIPKGFEIDQENSNLLEGKIVFKEIKNALPKTWEELERIKGFYVDNYCEIEKTNECLIAYNNNRNVFATKELAEASIAMAQLSQLREAYRQGWKPNWNDGNHKYSICFHKDTIDKTFSSYMGFYLSFQSPEIRDEFLKNFRDLIKTAKPLFS